MNVFVYFLIASLLTLLPLLSRAQLGVPGFPRQYVCYRSGEALTIDGKLDEAAWEAAPWTETFMDIEGPDHQPQPRLQTHAKMLWDSTYFYIAAELEEPHLWGRLKQRDTVIFQDNDFEVFIDPDGDTHLYYEFEINALGTEWDLMLIKPYRDGGPAINAWNMNSMKSGLDLQGTLNDPSDEDKGWTVEIAFPWSDLKEAARPRGAPEPGDQWRINFSRVQWDLNVTDGRYEKQRDPVTGRRLREHNWVWSPQGLINMHCPEHWGYVQFSSKTAGQGTDIFVAPRDVEQQVLLRTLYDAQRQYHDAQGTYADAIEVLDLPLDANMPIELFSTPSMYEARVPASDGNGYWYIRQDGKLWRSESK